MTDAAAGIPPVPPPPPEPGPTRLLYDGAFIGPMLPPGLAAPDPGPALAPPTEAVLAIPLGTRKLVSQALDLLTRQDAGLRSASFYIGLMVLVTVAPVIMLVALGAVTGSFETDTSSALPAWAVLAALPAFAGYTAAATEARTLATVVIGGRAEARPLRLRESISVARRRFWKVLGANVVVGFVTSLAASIVQLPIAFALGNDETINFGLSLVVGTLVGAPFAYVAAGIVLGEVGVFEAISRSLRLARARPRLAIVVALFSILSQFIVLFGVSIGGDVVVRVIGGAGITVESFPVALVIPLTAALVFAFGTLLFLVEAITAAPAVYAFVALTHYTHGLQVGRDEPAPGSSVFSPWFTPGLALVAAVALLALLMGVATLGG
jgi:hypothetical protein